MLMEITKNYNAKNDGKAATKVLQGDLPGGSGAETPHSQCRGQVPSMIRELDLTFCH